MKRTIIIGCGFPQLSLIRRARSLGLSVMGVDMNESAVGVPYCDDFSPISTADADAIAELVRRSGATAVASTGSELAVRTAQAVSSQTNLPFYVDAETLRRCQEKDKMRAAYALGGARVPKFVSVRTLDDALCFADDAPFPLVIKPARGWGQRGVARLDTREELVDAFPETMHHAASAGLSEVMLEQWITGREYSVNGWVEDGTLASYCVTERITVPGKRPLGVMVAELYPSGLSASDEQKVIEEARRGARAVGLSRGPCYSQVAWDGSTAYLFETAARTGGGFDADVTLLASGVDLYCRILGVATGNADWERSGVVAPRHPAAIAKFKIERPGTVRGISGLEAVRAEAGVHDAQVFVSVGGRVEPLTDSAKRAAYVLASAESREAVVERADRLLSQIQIDT